jgi:hypothetical protein
MRKTGFVVLIVLLLGCGKGKPEPATWRDPPNGPTSRPPGGVGEPKFNLPVGELLDAFETNADATVKTYGGNAIQLDGLVRDVHFSPSTGPSGGGTVVNVMPTRPAAEIEWANVRGWPCNFPGVDLTPRLIPTRRIRIKGYLNPADPRTSLVPLTRCEIVELGTDDALRVSAAELSAAATENVEAAYRKYSRRAVVLTGVVKGKAKDVGGAECVELVTGGEVRVLGYPGTFLAAEAKAPRTGEKVTWAGILSGQFNSKDPYVLWNYWVVKDEER